MIKIIKVNIDGQERMAIEVDRVRISKRHKMHNGRIYEWEERRLNVYIPKHIRAKRFIVVPLD